MSSSLLISCLHHQQVNEEEKISSLKKCIDDWAKSYILVQKCNPSITRSDKLSRFKDCDWKQDTLERKASKNLHPHCCAIFHKIQLVIGRRPGEEGAKAVWEIPEITLNLQSVRLNILKIHNMKIYYLLTIPIKQKPQTPDVCWWWCGSFVENNFSSRTWIQSFIYLKWSFFQPLMCKLLAKSISQDFCT